jgi:poly(A) polymerase
MIVKRNTGFPFSQELKILFSLINKDDSLRIVGGAVRDFLAHKDINDIDLACKFKPEVTKKLLSDGAIKSIDTGIKHGTITAIINGKTFEITTLRKDVETYGRKAKVEFVDDYLSDAQRRDFTINAMSIDEQGNLYDYFNGFKDLKDKKVRFIGDAELRIKEDFLRILRFFRFSCYYSDKIDELALKNIILHKGNLKELSAHRVRTELIKTIQCDDHIKLLEIMSEMNDNQIFNEILLTESIDLVYLKNLCHLFASPHHEHGVLLKFCALTYSCKDDMARIIDLLEFSNKEKRYISEVINISSKINLDTSKSQIIKLLFDFDKCIVSDALKLNIASSDNKIIFDRFSNLQKLINDTNLPKFILNGNDLKDLNIKPRDIGIILKDARNFWIDSDFKATKKELLDKFC